MHTKGTVEFRRFQSTLNSRAIIDHAQFCVAFAETFSSKNRSCQTLERYGVVDAEYRDSHTTLNSSEERSRMEAGLRRLQQDQESASLSDLLDELASHDTCSEDARLAKRSHYAQLFERLLEESIPSSCLDKWLSAESSSV
eukprot:g66921.t1